MSNTLSAAQWQDYERDGFLRLGRLLADEELAAMNARLDDIMLGKTDLDYSRMVMQLEGEAGEYNRAGPQTRGFKKATLAHRVVYGLEYDPLFLAYLQRPLFREICARVYGQATPITTYRAFVMNKPAHGGSDLGWHQDRWTFLKPDPLVTVWTALAPATRANGCLEVIRGSHAFVVNPMHENGGLEDRHIAAHCKPENAIHLELGEGEVLLLHNWLLHRSGINTTDRPRRGFSACYMDGRTEDARPPEQRDSVVEQVRYPMIFGEGALEATTV
jgi:hypothetical protein